MTTIRPEVHSAAVPAIAGAVAPIPVVVAEVAREAIDQGVTMMVETMEAIFAITGGLLLSALFLWGIIRLVTRDRADVRSNDGWAPDHQGRASGGGPANGLDSGEGD